MYIQNTYKYTVQNEKKHKTWEKKGKTEKKKKTEKILCYIYVQRI